MPIIYLSKIWSNVVYVFEKFESIALDIIENLNI